MNSCPVSVERSVPQPVGTQAAAPAPGAPDYLTPVEVAELLRVKNVKSIYRWTKADPTMPVLKIGGTVRFPRERLARWLRDREQGRPRPRLRSAP